MSWIPQIMILDDDPRVLESFIPGFAHEIARSLSADGAIERLLQRGQPPGLLRSPFPVRISAHGYASERLGGYRHRSPYAVHVHLVLEQGGRFDLARRLLNSQPFAVVVSDLRFSDDLPGQRAGQLFVQEAGRIHPEVEGLLYSAYPRPEDFPADRFVRKGAEQGPGGLVEAVVQALRRHLADPAVAAFVQAVADQNLIYQSDAFGSVLAQLFGLARHFGLPAPPSGGRARRPLSCLLIDGESGTGKRGLTSVFHAASDRRNEPLVVASCNELTNETLLRSILFGHKRGAFTDAREDRRGLVSAAGRGVLLLDDFHRLPAACSAILHSFLEDGEYSRLGEEEVRRQAECAVVLTVETTPWRELRRAGELPLAFLARVERLPLAVPPLRERPEDIVAQANWLARTLSQELGVELSLSEDALKRLKAHPFAESNSRELRNVLERAFYRHYREIDTLEWEHLQAGLPESEAQEPSSSPALAEPTSPPVSSLAMRPPSNDWQPRLEALAAKILAKNQRIEPDEAHTRVRFLFEQRFPDVWAMLETARRDPWSEDGYIPQPLWDDLLRCFAVSWLGGPSPSEKVLGIPANTLRQWINDRESR